MSIGIQNLGNTCSINTLVQCLYHVECFRDIILRSEFKDYNTIGWQLQNIFQILDSTKSTEDGGVVQPNAFISVLQKTSNGMFPANEQHDLCELFVWIVHNIHEDICMPYTQDTPLTRNARMVQQRIMSFQNEKRSDVLEAAQGVTIKLLECAHCKSHAHHVEPFTFYHLDISSCSDGAHLCELFMKEFIVEKLAEWKCDACKNLGGLQQPHLWSVPDMLVIVLKRFDSSMKKITTAIHIPPDLVFAKGTLLHNPDASCRYVLKSVGNHSGSCGYGHYTTIALTEKGAWLHYDDTQISRVEDIHAHLQNNCDGYVLFYERCES